MEYLGPGAEDVSPQAAAGILIERLKNAGDFGDRRDALDALLSMSQSHPQEVGQAGMRTFTDILQAGIADGSMTQTIMEIMLNLVTEREGSGMKNTGANINTFLMDVQNIQSLLDLLESQDTLTALTAVQVRPFPNQKCIVQQTGRNARLLLQGFCTRLADAYQSCLRWSPGFGHPRDPTSNSPTCGPLASPRHFSMLTILGKRRGLGLLWSFFASRSSWASRNHSGVLLMYDGQVKNRQVRDPVSLSA